MEDTEQFYRQGAHRLAPNSHCQRSHRKRGGGGPGDYRIFGEHGRDTCDDSEKRLLTCVAEHEMTTASTIFHAPANRGSSSAYTHERPKDDNRWRLDYILIRQQDRKTSRNVTFHPELKSDHRLVSASIRCLGRSAPNHKPKPGGGFSGVYLDRQLPKSDRQ